MYHEINFSLNPLFWHHMASLMYVNKMYVSGISSMSSVSPFTLAIVLVLSFRRKMTFRVTIWHLLPLFPAMIAVHMHQKLSFQKWWKVCKIGTGYLRIMSKLISFSSFQDMQITFRKSIKFRLKHGDCRNCLPLESVIAIKMSMPTSLRLTHKPLIIIKCILGKRGAVRAMEYAANPLKGCPREGKTWSIQTN